MGWSIYCNTSQDVSFFMSQLVCHVKKCRLTMVDMSQYTQVSCVGRVSLQGDNLIQTGPSHVERLKHMTALTLQKLVSLTCKRLKCELVRLEGRRVRTCTQLVLQLNVTSTSFIRVQLKQQVKRDTNIDQSGTLANSMSNVIQTSH